MSFFRSIIIQLSSHCRGTLLLYPVPCTLLLLLLQVVYPTAATIIKMCSEDDSKAMATDLVDRVEDSTVLNALQNQVRLILSLIMTLHCSVEHVDPRNPGSLQFGQRPKQWYCPLGNPFDPPTSFHLTSTRTIFPPLALQEISFWLTLERPLLRIQEKRESFEVALILDNSKHDKRFHATSIEEVKSAISPYFS